MQKPGDLLNSVLNEIEKRIKEDINADFLAEYLGLSSVHLQRLFNFAFKQPLGAYIRSRKLMASLESLFSRDSKLVDIALEYGFEYEQSYVRTFKREFGITPGVARKTRQIIKITPPFNLLDSILFDKCIIFKSEIVMVPQFHVIGRTHKIPYSDSTNMAPKIVKYFCEKERGNIPNALDPNVYIGLIKTGGIDADYNWYLPSIQVKALKNIPEGFDGYTFNPSLCAKFRYIGQHHYYEIDQEKIINIHSAIEKFFNCDYSREFCLANGTYFVKVYGLSNEGNFCHVEWFIPIKKIENDEKC